MPRPPLLALCLALASFALALAPASGAHAAVVPVLVQRRQAALDSGASLSLSFAKATKAGNLLVAFVVWDNDGSVSLSDDAGNVWTSVAGPTQSGGSDSLRAQLFYASDVAGGKTAVTATFSSDVQDHALLFLHEYANVQRIVPFDAATAASGGGADDMQTDPLAIAGSRELLFVGAATDGTWLKRLTRGFRARAFLRGALTADSVSRSSAPVRVSALQNGAGWILQLAAFAGAKPHPVYPVRVSKNGRTLMDGTGAPFLINGDSPQALMVNVSEDDADAYFANRERRGFNTVWINLLCAEYTGGRADASTFDGIVPFTGGLDLMTPNKAYFARVDDVLRLAAKHHLLVVLDPIETGSFLPVLRQWGVDKARAYGRYLGKRYRAFPNILWMHGNDYNWNTDDDALVQAVARGIQDVDKLHLHTVELNFLVSGSLDDASWAPLIDLNASYTYYPTYAQVLKDYDRPSAPPTFMVEASYEFENDAANRDTPFVLRRQAYWSVLAGATGHLYGNSYTWPFRDDWQDHYDTAGAIQMGYVERFFESLDWSKLVPDQTHMVVTDGLGTFEETGSPSGNDHLTAGRTPDGALVVAYLPTVRTITVDMSQLSGPAQGWWFDPSRGTREPIEGGPFENAGPRQFTPPGDNGDGDGDWLLVLEAAD